MTGTTLPSAWVATRAGVLAFWSTSSSRYPRGVVGGGSSSCVPCSYQRLASRAYARTVADLGLGQLRAKCKSPLPRPSPRAGDILCGYQHDRRGEQATQGGRGPERREAPQARNADWSGSSPGGIQS